MTAEIETEVPWLDALKLPEKPHNDVLRNVLALRQATGLLRDAMRLLRRLEVAVISPREEVVMLDSGISPPCEKPPAGWVCSRNKGHDPPCAASERTVSEPSTVREVASRDLPSGPPVAVLASGSYWSLSIVLYPSGPCLELIEVVDGGGSRLAYSESVRNLVLAGEVPGERSQ